MREKIKSAWRINLLAALVISGALVLSGRLFVVQVLRGAQYRISAEGQYQNSTDQIFNRGSIFFETKDGVEVSAATLEDGYVLAINPTLLKDPIKTYDRLNEVYPLPEAEFMTSAALAGVRHRQLASRLSAEVATKIQALELPGVILNKQYFRSYPGGRLAAHTIGFMGYQGVEYAGRYGLERQYDSILKRGQTPSFTNFISRLFSGDKPTQVESGQGDVITTLEPKLQSFLENELGNLVEKWKIVGGGGIVLEPSTGRILALAARPDFDPGAPKNDLSVLPNPLLENVYEVGSIIKLLTMTAGLDAGVVSEESTYNDVGSLLIDGRIVSNYDYRARGVVSMQEVLNQSLNTGAIFVMRSLGLERFRDYFFSFGLGEKTGIELPGEVSGLINNLENGRELEYATASFGQGIAITPLETVMALSVLANEGRLVKPQVVDRFRYENGRVEDLPIEEGRQVVKPETAKRLTAMLVKTVDEALVGGDYSLDHYQVAAKTGTAQIPRPGGGYEEDEYLHSFFGYFPASEPRFSIFLYALRPEGADYASQTLTEPFFNLTKFLLNYYQVPPDR